MHGKKISKPMRSGRTYSRTAIDSPMRSQVEAMEPDFAMTEVRCA